ncbi:MAG TPA: tRNA lysidine(34) synthetase TilS, partial [Ignavibacteriaceae bacterium]
NLLIKKGDKILISLSGGADSVFLLYFLNKFKKRFRIKIGSFHLNHGLRANEADEDENFCRTISEELNIPFYSVLKNVKELAEKDKISIEEAGRKIRYQELQAIAAKNNFDKIATAHNSNDNAETILLNLVKGTGLQGLSGIPVKRENIIRPVLILNKEEILFYLEKSRISFRTDISNLSNNYERNFLRNEILPRLRNRLNPQLENSMFTSSQNLREINSFINKLIQKFINECVRAEKKKIIISLKKLNKLDKDLSGNFFKTVLEKYFDIEPNSEIVHSLNSLTLNQKGKKLDLGNNISAVREQNEIIIFHEEKNRQNFVEEKFKQGKTIRLKNKKLSIQQVKKPLTLKHKTKNIEYISADNLNGEFEIRNWIDGDRFKPLGMKGTKKVSDFLNEQKIPAHRKKSQLLLLNSGKIVWVIGLRIDERYKVESKTKKVFELCLK